jgi:DNA-binding response OmpR family regulator
LITDVRLGRSSGWDLVQFVRQTHPDLPVIVVTGFHEAITEAEAVRLRVPVFLKPFEPDQLLDYVRHRLPTREAGLDPVPVLASLTNAVEADFYAGINESTDYLMRTVYSRALEHLQVRRRHTELQLSLVSSSRRCRRVLAFAHPGRLAIFQEALDRHLLHTGWTVVESETKH